MNTLGESSIRMKNRDKESRLTHREPEYVKLNITEASE